MAEMTCIRCHNFRNIMNEGERGDCFITGEEVEEDESCDLFELLGAISAPAVPAGAHSDRGGVDRLRRDPEEARPAYPMELDPVRAAAGRCGVTPVSDSIPQEDATAGE